MWQPWRLDDHDSDGAILAAQSTEGFGIAIGRHPGISAESSSATPAPSAAVWSASVPLTRLHTTRYVVHRAGKIA